MTPLKDVVVAPVSSSLTSVASLMLEYQISCVVIVADGDVNEFSKRPANFGTTRATQTLGFDDSPSVKPLGLITSTDMVKAYAQGKKGEETTAKEIMSYNFTMVSSSLVRDAVAELMMKENKHHVFVKDDFNDNIIGLVSSVDVVKETALDAKWWPYHREYFIGLM